MITDAQRDRLGAYKHAAHNSNPDDPHAKALLDAGYIREIDNDESTGTDQKRHEITAEGEAALAEATAES